MQPEGRRRDAAGPGIRPAFLQPSVRGAEIQNSSRGDEGAHPRRTGPVHAAGEGLGGTRECLAIPARRYRADITMYCRAFRACTARQVQPDQPERGGVGLGAGGELLRRPQRHRPAHPRRLWLRLSAGWFACVCARAGRGGGGAVWIHAWASAPPPTSPYGPLPCRAGPAGRPPAVCVRSVAKFRRV